VKPKRPPLEKAADIPETFNCLLGLNLQPLKVYEVFVNGNSFIPNAKALEPVFKARMFAEVQA